MAFISHPSLKKNNAGTAGASGGGAKEGTGQIPGQEQEEPTSYIRKYWYLFLPLMIANFMGVGAPSAAPEGESDQGADGSDGAATTSAPAASDGARQRRGKRR